MTIRDSELSLEYWQKREFLREFVEFLDEWRKTEEFQLAKRSSPSYVVDTAVLRYRNELMNEENRKIQQQRRDKRSLMTEFDKYREGLTGDEEDFFASFIYNGG